MSDATFMISVAKSLRQFAGADPAQLPVIIHHERGWPGKPFADVLNRLHVNSGQLEILKTMVPIKEVKRHAADIVEFRIALEAHHLEGGFNDNVPLIGPARDDLLKGAVGLNPDYSDKVDEADQIEEVFGDADRPPREI